MAMPLIDVDFSRALRARQRACADVATITTAIVAIFASGILYWQAAPTERAVNQARVDIARKTDELRHREARAVPKPLSHEEVVAVNNAVRQLNLPWSSLFDAVEEATTSDVAVLSLTPAAAGETLAVIAEARNSNAMFVYVDRLRTQPFFSDVSITRHEVNENDAYKPIRFELAARWTRPR